MKPGNADWLAPCDSPFQCDVISFIHYTVLKGLSEKGWIQTTSMAVFTTH